MKDNINKKAASIELYLPDRIIKKGSDYLPIEWESRKKIKDNGEDFLLYQGVITQKDTVKREFHELRRSIEDGREMFVTEEWRKMNQLLNSIIFAFC